MKSRLVAGRFLVDEQYKGTQLGAGEMALGLRALTALAGGPSSVPNTYIEAHNLL